MEEKIDDILEIKKIVSKRSDGLIRSVVPKDKLPNGGDREIIISIEEMESPSRKREIVVARHVAMVITHNLLGITLKEIGACFGNRDHSTIIHARGAVEDEMGSSAEYKKLFNQAMEECRILVKTSSGLNRLT